MCAQDYDEVYPGLWTWSPAAIYAHSPYLYPPGFTFQQSEQLCQTCPYVKNAQVIGCPSRQGNVYSYGYAYPTMWGTPVPIPGSAYSFSTGPSLAEFQRPADTVMIAESAAWPETPQCNATSYPGIYSLCASRIGYAYPYVYQPTTNQWSAPFPIHHERVTVAFVDGHVKSKKVEPLINMWQR